jgi:hypothetical protein
MGDMNSGAEGDAIGQWDSLTLLWRIGFFLWVYLTFSGLSFVIYELLNSFQQLTPHALLILCFYVVI